MESLENEINEFYQNNPKSRVYDTYRYNTYAVGKTLAEFNSLQKAKNLL